MSEEKYSLSLVTMSNFPGVITTMKNMVAVAKKGAATLDLIKDNNIDSIPKRFFDAEKAVLGGWNPVLYPQLCKKRNQVSILICSSIGQMEMSNIEPSYMKEIIELKNAGKIDRIIVGSPEVFAAYYYLVTDVVLMPYPVDLEEFPTFELTKKPFMDVGLFFPFHSRKNILNQVYGIMFSDRMMKDRGQISSINLVTNGDLSLTNLKVECLGWLPRKEYLKTIKRMKLGLHVTFTESFGYGAFDYILSGVPVLISTTVACNLAVPASLNQYLMVINSDSATEISTKALKILEMEEEDYRHLSMSCRVHAKDFAMEQNRKFLQWLPKFLSGE